MLHLQYDPGFMHVFDSDGGFLGRIGKQGTGPGEFLTVQIITWGPDMLIAFDYQNQRGSVLDDKGETLTTIPLRGMFR